MRLKGKGILLVVLSISMFFHSMFALGETSCWNCPECGRNSNMGNYCGGCAHPAPWLSGESQIPTVDKVSILLGLDPSADEMDQQVHLLVEQAKTWTSKTAPQTLDSFPLIFDTVFQLYNEIVAAPIKIEEKDSEYYMNTTISDIVSGWYLGEQTDILLGYERDNHFLRIELTRIDDHTYTFALPDGVVLGENGMDFVRDYSWISIGKSNWQEENLQRKLLYWQEGLQITHNVENEKVNELTVGIVLTNGAYRISSICGFSLLNNRDDENILSINIALENSWSICTLEYDIKNRTLLEFE